MENVYWVAVRRSWVASATIGSRRPLGGGSLVGFPPWRTASARVTTQSYGGAGGRRLMMEGVLRRPQQGFRIA